MQDNVERVALRTVSERVWGNNQDNWFERTIAAGETRLRVQIRSNAYEHQSFGRVERWDGNAWQTVVRLEGPTLSCWDSTRPARKPSAADFDPDVDRMVAETLDVLGIDGEVDA